VARGHDSRAPRTIFLDKEPLITNKDISEARVVLDDRDQPGVEVRFVPAARQKMRDATEAHRGKPLAILVDGRVVTAPIVRWQIGESAWIQGGGISRDEAERIAKSLSGRK
jgi:preprotein translocase subunit SecD